MPRRCASHCNLMRSPEYQSHHMTLLDGELIVDEDRETGKHTYRYLAYDAMAINGVSLVNRPWKVIQCSPALAFHSNKASLQVSKAPQRGAAKVSDLQLAAYHSSLLALAAVWSSCPFTGAQQSTVQSIRNAQIRDNCHNPHCRSQSSMGHEEDNSWLMQERWQAVEDGVLKMRQRERFEIEKDLAAGLNRYPVHYQYQSELVRMLRKGFFPLWQAKKLLLDVIPTLSHESDGLIFQVCTAAH